MEKSWLLIPIAVLLFCGQGTAAEAPESVATKEAKAWLLILDHGRYGDSWDAAAKLFRDAVTREAWNQAVKAARDPLGNVVSRNLKSARFVTALPGAPDGKYVVIQFVTSFDRKKKAIETVTPMQEPDGSWKVSEIAPIPWTPGLCRQRIIAQVGFGLVRGPVAVV